MPLWCACLSYGALDFLLDLLLCCINVIFHPFTCIVLEFSMSLFCVFTHFTLFKACTHTCLILKKFSAIFLCTLILTISSDLFPPACSLLPNWNALLKHFNLTCEVSHSLDVLILNPSLGRQYNPFVLKCKDFSSSLWVKLSFRGGVFTLFHCSIPRARNHGNHHTRESLKGFFCVHQTFSLSLSLSLSLAIAIVSFQGFVFYIISV